MPVAESFAEKYDLTEAKFEMVNAQSFIAVRLPDVHNFNLSLKPKINC